MVRPGRAVRPEPAGRAVIVDLDGASVSITGLGPGLLHLRSAPGRRWAPRRSWAVTTADEAFPRTELELRDGDHGSTSAVGDGLAASISAGGRLSIAAGDRPLMRDAEVTSIGGGLRWSFGMPPDRRFFGFGERTGSLDKRGRRYTCWTTDEWRQQDDDTDALYVAIPFYLGLDADGHAHGIFLDSTFRSTFDLRDTEGCRMAMWAASPGLDWYVIDGPDPATVVRRFSELVGRAPLPPRWGLGYHQARWSYETEAEAREVADGLRANAIPADAIHLDIHHFDRYRAFTWDRERFPDPGGLVRSLADAGLHTTVVVDAPVTIDAGSEEGVYSEGRRRDAYVRASSARDADEVVGHLWGGPSVYPDHLRPDVRDWWGSLYRRDLDLGISGFANDMNEPAMHDRPMDDPETRNIEPPPDAPFGPPDERTTHAEARNVYALLEDAATRVALLETRPDERPFLITRSGYAGIQRHAIVWTGDNWSRWEHLAMSLPQLLNLGLSGVPIAGADIGGFFEDCSAELLVRWMQLAAFYPFARNNAAIGTRRQEPWAFGEPTTTRCRRAIELRYRLLPYLYTVVEEAARLGDPILRPLFFHAPDDRRAVAVEDQALVGHDLMIAPVLAEGVTERRVYLPSGVWYDLRGADRHAGGREAFASATLDEDLPIFARGGSVIPSAPVMRWSDERRVDPLTLDIYLDGDGAAEGRLYEDDGQSMAYLDGVWCETRLVAAADDGGTRVTAERSGGWRPPKRAVVVRVHDEQNVREMRLADAERWTVTL